MILRGAHEVFFLFLIYLVAHSWVVPQMLKDWFDVFCVVGSATDTILYHIVTNVGNRALPFVYHVAYLGIGIRFVVIWHFVPSLLSLVFNLVFLQCYGVWLLKKIQKSEAARHIVEKVRAFLQKRLKISYNCPAA